MPPSTDRVVQPRLGIGQAGQQVRAAWLAGRDVVDEVLDGPFIPNGKGWRLVASVLLIEIYDAQRDDAASRRCCNHRRGVQLHRAGPGQHEPMVVLGRGVGGASADARRELSTDGA